MEPETFSSHEKAKINLSQSLREAFGTGKLLAAVIAFFVIPWLIVLVIMILSGFSRSGLIWATLAWLLAVSFVTYLVLTIKFNPAVSEKTVHVSAPLKHVSEAIPRVISLNHWKMAQADSTTGTYKAKIGMTFQTWGQIMLISVSRIEEMLTQVDVRCEALGQSYDWGRNNAAIDRFCASLEDALKLQL